MYWHSMSSAQIIKHFNSSEDTGLNIAQVIKMQGKYGKNKLKEQKQKSFLAKFIEQFADFLILILLAAAVISAVTAYLDGSHDYIDTIIIFAIVILNAAIGVIQESKAEKAILALKKLSAPKALAIRNGKKVKLASEDLVPGDIILLEAGDFVPADARIISSNNLSCEESSLTGESVASEKNSSVISKKNLPLGDRKNMVFSSCSVTTGNAKCVVVQTGMDTQIGHIANMIDSETTPNTPLQKKLAQTGKILGIAAIIICIIIFALGVMQGKGFMDMFMTSVSLAVAAIPESLPAVVTIVLAMGVRKLAANKAIIRNLPAVETLGSANVICSDKTGTLTQNKMTVKEIRNQDGIISKGQEISTKILKLAALCNNASLVKKSKNYSAIGDPTETAIILAANDIGEDKNSLDEKYKRIFEVPFDSSKKFMTTVHKLSHDNYRIITKGAPDVLIKKCKYFIKDNKPCELDQNTKENIALQNKQMAENALRVIAVAYKDENISSYNQNNLEENLIFCGLIGMIDPPRKGVKEAVKECLKAGIKPVMITGDHIITAKAIAKELLIFNKNDKAISASELDKMPQEKLEKEIFNYSVFARVSPKHKVRIVKAFQSRGAVVAMTGDGVNDAPALKVADIGCAMGQTGTDVAKGAADMIMTDDNFTTIVKAVHEGRGIFDNIKKTVRFLVSCNVGEILLILVASLLKMPIPLLAIQLLWVNLVTDSLPALALGCEPAEDNIMSRKPLKKNEGLFSGGVAYNMVVEGLFIGAISLLAFVIGASFFDKASANIFNPIIGRTMAFAVLSISELVHAFNVKSEASIFNTHLFNNKKLIFSFFICLLLEISVICVPAFAGVFKCAVLSTFEWLIVAALALSPLIIVEIEKLFARVFNK